MTIFFKILITSAALVVLTLFSQPAVSQSVVPPHVHSYEFVKHQNSSSGHFFVTPLKLQGTLADSTKVLSTLCIINTEGELIWFYQEGIHPFLNFNFYPDLNLFSFHERKYSGKNYNITLDTLLLPADTFYTFQAKSDTHEFWAEDDNTFLMAARKDSSADLSGYLFNGNPGPSNASLQGFQIQEQDSLGNLIFRWNTNDHISPDEMVDDYTNAMNSARFDYAHGNSIDKDEFGYYYISLRHTNCICKIDSTGQIVWRLGGENSNFTFPNDRGFSGQHDARILDNGNISLFDNSNTHFPHFTRGVEYSIDTMSWEATKVNEFSYNDTIYSSAQGNYHICSDNSRVLNFGSIFRPNPSFIRLDSTNNLISELSFVDSVISYRTFFYPGDIPGLSNRPYIYCQDTIGGKLLSVDQGFDNFIWNTGDTTHQIYVTNNGTYQCWVTHGVGMIGSELIEIDLADICEPNLSIQSANKPQQKMIVGYYNLLGQEVLKPLPFQIYIVLYTDGSSKKTIFFEGP